MKKDKKTVAYKDLTRMERLIYSELMEYVNPKVEGVFYKDDDVIGVSFDLGSFIIKNGDKNPCIYVKTEVDTFQFMGGYDLGDICQATMIRFSFHPSIEDDDGCYYQLEVDVSALDLDTKEGTSIHITFDGKSPIFKMFHL